MGAIPERRRQPRDAHRRTIYAREPARRSLPVKSKANGNTAPAIDHLSSGGLLAVLVLVFRFRNCVGVRSPDSKAGRRANRSIVPGGGATEANPSLGIVSLSLWVIVPGSQRLDCIAPGPSVI